MKLSIDTKTWEDFSSEAFASFADTATHIYIDTSFLMWLTKIGPKSFGEFKDWISATCPGRFYVPIWAGHEYANHYVARTLADELDAATGELSGVAKSAYSKLRPFLDGDLVAGKAVEAQQVQLRNALSALETAADNCRQWKSHYQDRTKAVMSFITENSLRSTPVFELMNSFPALGIARFDGRIPPGFQDRGKKQRTVDDAEDGKAVTGSNKYGDLIFWREILDHAKTVQARHVILLSKDGKNDWLFGGGTQPNDVVLREMGRKWKPLPVPHPMLAFEAFNTAQVEGVSLIDSAYLGALLRQQQVPGVSAFVDVAVVPDPPPPIDEQKAAKQAAMAKLPPEQRHQQAPSSLFPDGNNVASTPPALERAISQCRANPPGATPMGMLVQQMRELVASGEGISSLLTEQNFASRTTNELATFGRVVHAHVLSGTSPEYTEAAADLLAKLEQFPEKTGGAVLLGMLVAMYVPVRGECRLPATSPLLDALYSVSRQAFAKAACEAVSLEIDKQEMQPLFRLTGSVVEIDAKFDIDETNRDEDSIASLSLANEEVLSEPQFGMKLNLRNLSNGKEHLSGAQILELTGRMLGIPVDAINGGVDADRPYFISEKIGFKNPKTVFVDGQEETA
ncbi:hypothetical protein CDN99_27470 [Roseateles aquatilis]|uniref:PIN like domain-containing protein n=1 Tax=Roseateles aquatilis TaxID=431061 RepID=A0A246ISB0_9BURK|nr:PIN-like domain-containing protein [Roseateles aquatilis]OWQ83042.1 hypothetical protein CDN99_27470 [Roseateles aquatilis]